MTTAAVNNARMDTILLQVLYSSVYSAAVTVENVSTTLSIVLGVTLTTLSTTTSAKYNARTTSSCHLTTTRSATPVTNVSTVRYRTRFIVETAYDVTESVDTTS